MPITPPEEIVYCVSTVKKMMDSGISFIFTDGHAVNGLTKFYDDGNVETLDKLIDFEAVKAKSWKSDIDLDLKRRKEAEFLAAGDLPADVIVGFVVYNELAKEKLQNMGILAEKIAVRAEYYF